MNGTTITGYLFGEEPYCADCIRDLFLPFELIGDEQASTEDVLDAVAHERGINRHDPKSYSSYQFPRPIYLSEASTADQCVLCGRPLGPASH